MLVPFSVVVLEVLYVDVLSSFVLRGGRAQEAAHQALVANAWREKSDRESERESHVFRTGEFRYRGRESYGVGHARSMRKAVLSSRLDVCSLCSEAKKSNPKGIKESVVVLLAGHLRGRTKGMKAC